MRKFALPDSLQFRLAFERTTDSRPPIYFPANLGRGPRSSSWMSFSPLPLLVGAGAGAFAWLVRTNDGWKDWWSGWALAAALCFLGEFTSRSSDGRSRSIKTRDPHLPPGEKPTCTSRVRWDGHNRTRAAKWSTGQRVGGSDPGSTRSCARLALAPNHL